MITLYVECDSMYNEVIQRIQNGGTKNAES